MTTYRVHVQNTVSSVIDVEFDGEFDADAIVDLALASDDMPSGITVGAFGQSNVDDGDWEPVAITHPGGRTEDL